MTLTKALRALLIVFALVILVLAVALLWLSFSSSGLRTVASLAVDNVDGLYIETIDGELAGELSVESLKYNSETLSIELASGSLNWSPRLLLEGAVLIESLVLEGLTITQSGDDEIEQDKEKFSLPDRLPLPVHVIVEDFRLNGMEFFSVGSEEPFVLHSISFRGDADDEQINIEHLQATAEIFDVEGSISTVAADAYDTNADLQWRYRADELPEFSGDLQVSGTAKHLALKLLADTQAAQHSAGSKISLQGTASDLLTNPTADLIISWDELVWPLGTNPKAETLAQSKRGELTIKGSLQEYSLGLTAALNALDNDAQLKASATGSDQQLNLRELQLGALKGTLTGQANIGWQEGLSSNFQLGLNSIDPGLLNADWPGSIDGTLQGSLQNEQLQLQQLKLTGVLRSRPFQLSAAGRFSEQALSIADLQLISGESTLGAKGDIAETLQLDWSLLSPDAADLYPGASGRIRGSGTISGERNSPLIKASLNAEQLAFESYSAEAVSLQADVDLSQVKNQVKNQVKDTVSRSTLTPSSLQLRASDLQLDGTVVKTIELVANGTAAANTAVLEVISPAIEFDMELAGELDQKNGQWKGLLESVKVSPRDYPGWEQREAAQLSLSADKQSLAYSCWQSAEASICAELDRNASNTNAQLDLQKIPINYALSQSLSDIDVAGELNGSADIRMPAGKEWQAELDVDTTPITVTTTSSVEILSLLPGKVRVRAQPKLAEASLVLPMQDSEGIQAQLSVASEKGDLANGSLDGSMQVEINDLDFLSSFTDEIDQSAGRLNADLKLLGSPAKPAPTGEIRLTDAALELYTPGLSLSNINGAALANGDGQINFDLSADSNEGALEIKGESILASGETSLSLTSERVQIWNTEDAKVWAAPNLQISLLDNRILIGGSVHVPEAEISPQELPVSAVSVSEDQIIVDAEAGSDATAALPTETEIDLKVTLGDAVAVDSFGFSGRIEGAINVLQKDKRPLSASGKLNILDGEYRAYGQGLVVEQGEILFAGGSIDNPAVRVRAARRPADDIVVGVNVRGEVSAPTLELFSEPGMGQSEQLSWLVLGRSLQTASDSETDYVAQAALALGLRGNDFLASNIGDKLGLDTLSIQAGSGEAGAASDVSSAALVVGKYLTPKLYISYGVGLLDSLSTVRLRYSMTNRWNLTTESSALSSGGDLSYTFDK